MKKSKTVAGHVAAFKKETEKEKKEPHDSNVAIPMTKSYRRKYAIIQARTDKRFAAVARKLLKEAIDAAY